MDTSPTTPNTVPPAELPKKYIRTLAGDMATLKSGGTPDLAPMRPAVSSGEVGLTESKSSPLKTYASDFSDRMKATNASTATVLAAEQDAAPIRPQAEPRSSRNNILYIFAGVILFIAGGFGAYFIFVHYSEKLAPVISAPVISVPIFVDEKVQISGTGAVLLSAIEQSVAQSLAHNTVRLLYTENATTTDNSIFSALQIPAPNILLRNLNASNSMAGIISAGGGSASGGNINNGQSPFFILSVVSYSETFSGMLSWEPLMTRDLGALFPPYITPIVSTPVVASTTIPIVATTTTTTSTSSGQATSSTTKKVVTKIATTTSPLADSGLRSASTTPKVPTFIAGFRDEVINNHDVRVYRDVENRSVLLYGYWNQSTLVIARDQAAFVEIMLRLASSNTQ